MRRNSTGRVTAFRFDHIANGCTHPNTAEARKQCRLYGAAAAAAAEVGYQYALHREAYYRPEKPRPRRRA